MNEQLEKIWDKARDEVEQTNPQSWKIVDVREKFAELIIKDTMQVVANNVAWNSYMNAAEAVIDHFGVEQ